MSTKALLCMTLCSGVLLACGDDAATTDPDPAEPDASLSGGTGGGGGAQSEDDAATSDASSVTDDFVVLLEGDWELPAESEGYVCVRHTVTEDMYINEFAPIAPLGTHHTVLTVEDDPTEPDEVFGCAAGVSASRQIYGSGVGTEPLGPMPDGVAVKLEAGQQLNLNLHLFNIAKEPLTGTSGILVRLTDADQVAELAEVSLAGPLGLRIPMGRTTQSGHCTFEADGTIFTVAPHMHQLGVHMKAVAESSIDGSVTLFDGVYDFNEQRQYRVDPVEMAAGDVVNVECTYENDTDRTVMWGDSSLDEMCFIGLQRYPISGGHFLCTN